LKNVKKEQKTGNTCFSACLLIPWTSIIMCMPNNPYEPSGGEESREREEGEQREEISW
jgi:hypothetical protein